MSVLLLIVLGLGLGVVMGGLGGGGAILAVPALTFIIGESTTEAMTSSLVIVGVSSAVGVLAHLKASPTCCRVGWRLAMTLAVAGIPATWLGSRLSHELDDNVLMLAFAALMVVSAAVMWIHAAGGSVRRPDNHAPDQGPTGGPAVPASASGASGMTLVAEITEEQALASVNWPTAVISGLGIGYLTGFFGVGGGFLLVPVLVAVFKLPVRVAAGTSLAVITLNSITSLLARSTMAEFDWAVIVPFAAATIPASIVARRVAVRLPAGNLNRAFAALQLVVAAYTGIHSLINLT